MSKSIEEQGAVNVFTDGSCYPNTTPPTGKGGWAFVAKWGEKIVERYGHIPLATNNIAELTAIKEALIFVRLASHKLVVWTDSKYCKNALIDWHYGWKRSGWVNSQGQDVKNRELIEEILELIEQHEKVRDFDLRWTKGHAGNALNERADQLAGRGRTGE